jgi:hypothetical protein
LFEAGVGLVVSGLLGLHLLLALVKFHDLAELGKQLLVKVYPSV